jgi:hypothetical protein
MDYAQDIFTDVKAQEYPIGSATPSVEVVKGEDGQVRAIFCYSPLYGFCFSELVSVLDLFFCFDFFCFGFGFGFGVGI